MNLIKRFWTFVKESKYELDKVSWPTTKELWNATKAVIVVSLVVGAYLGAVDALIRYFMKMLVK